MSSKISKYILSDHGFAPFCAVLGSIKANQTARQPSLIRNEHNFHLHIPTIPYYYPKYSPMQSLSSLLLDHLDKYMKWLNVH